MKKQRCLIKLYFHARKDMNYRWKVHFHHYFELVFAELCHSALYIYILKDFCAEKNWNMVNFEVLLWNFIQNSFTFPSFSDDNLERERFIIMIKYFLPLFCIKTPQYFVLIHFFSDDHISIVWQHTFQSLFMSENPHNVHTNTFLLLHVCKKKIYIKKKEVLIEKLNNVVWMKIIYKKRHIMQFTQEMYLEYSA